jgi:hypothetical protein
MNQPAIFVTLMCAFFIVATSSTAAQTAEKKLGGGTQGVDSAQKESWDQVDKINKEADNTTARSQQSSGATVQQGGTKQDQKPAYSVKKSKISTRSPYKKPSATKKPPKKK